MMTEKWFSHKNISENSEANLLLFTYAGGNASSFAPWKKKISKRVSFFPILYPGRGRRINEEIPQSPFEMAEQFVKENEEIFDKKFIVFSHCTGALIAYEVCNLVRKQLGKTPLLFIASCSASPNFSLLEDDVSLMSDEDFLKILLDTGRIDEQTAKLPNFCEYYLPILKKDFIMMQNYTSDKNNKLSCRFHSVTADGDTLVKPEQIADWQNFSEKPVVNTKVSGSHFYIEKDVNWVCDYVNGLINECLE